MKILLALAGVGLARAQAPTMCDGTPVPAADGQLIAFGCVVNEVVQCGYDANANPNDYNGALAGAPFSAIFSTAVCPFAG